MKSTGIVRKIDKLGRIVLPMEMRRTMDLEYRDRMEIFVDGSNIIIRKYLNEDACEITGEISKDNKTYSGGLVLSPKGKEILLKEFQQENKKQLMHV